MPGAGEFTRRVRFDQRALDANNDRAGAWGSLGKRWAKVVSLKGTEAVQAERLRGSQPVVITVRADSVTRALDNTCRAVDVRDGDAIWDITSTIWNQGAATVEILATQRLGGDPG